MKIVRLTATALLLIAISANGFAALSKNFADFGKGPYSLLMTADEKKQWAAIHTDEQAQQFIDLFWARRDPTPATPANEFRDSVEQRVAVADTRFTAGRTKGSASDRGKVFILMGSPTSGQRTGNEPASTIQTPGAGANAGTLQHYSRNEIWKWEQGKTPLQLGQPVVEVAFVDTYGTNDWKMEKVARNDYDTVFDRIARTYITQPNMTELPTYTAAPAAASVAPAASTVIETAAPSANALTTEALRTAIATARDAGKASESLFVTTGEFITPAGEHFVPVQLWAPKGAGLSANTQVTFFGAVESEDGKTTVVSFEEPVTLSASNDDVFYARSLKLAPGSYRGTFGFAQDGKVLSVASKPIVVRGLEKAAPGVSGLMLSTHIYPMTEAQLPTDPFAFGGLKVVPRGNSTFRKADELWYFIEARNPGIDTTTNQPKLVMTVSIDGTTTEGKKVKMRGASQEAQAQELKGVTGHYGVGQAMPLGTFRPGNYTITIKLTDQVLSKNYELSESFRIVE